MKNDSLVTYIGKNEVIVCLLSIEPEFVLKTFGTGTGRYLEEYDRAVHVELHTIISFHTKAVRN